MNYKHSQQGFTLIELLVVVLVIGILAAVALPQYQKAVLKSRFVTIKNITHSLVQAEELHYLANGTYTENFTELSIDTERVVQNDGNKRKFANYSCKLQATSRFVYCVITRNGTEILKYQIYLNNGPRWCVAMNGHLAEEICKSETGKTESIASGIWAY